MSARGSVLSTSTVQPPPPDALYITILQSDGDKSKWPSPISAGAVRDSEGRWNFFRTIDLDERTSTDWRQKIGCKIAELLHYPNPKKYYLKDWPKGYSFFDHNKEQKDGMMRHDAYLCGSTFRFRSANEFIPHGLWLFQTTTMDKSECECKYCSKRKGQTEVNETVFGGASLQRPRNRPRTPTRNAGKESERSQRIAKENDATQRLKVSNKSTPEQTQGKSEFKGSHRYFRPRMALQEPSHRVSVVKALRYTDLHEQRRIREGELVWIPMKPPISCPTADTAILFWPALVDSFFHKKKVARISKTAYKVDQTITLTVRLAGMAQEIVEIAEGAALPFKAYNPCEVLIKALRNVPPPSNFSDISDEEMSPFRRENGKYQYSWTRVAHQYAFAIQVAAHITRYWAPVYEIEPPPTSLSSTKTCYQGLWWGSERIWMDEVIRLACSYDDLLNHPYIGRYILPARGGVATRSVLMKISSINVEDIPSPNGSQKICRVAGRLFGIRNMEPEENDHPSSVDPIIQTLEQNPHFPLPNPPLNYKLCHILCDPTMEGVLDAALIAGRYYPELLSNTALDLTKIKTTDKHRFLSLAALNGLAPGGFAKDDVNVLLRSRSEVAKRCDMVASKEMQKHWNVQDAEVDQSELTDQMEP